MMADEAFDFTSGPRPRRLFLNPSTGLPINSDTQAKIASVQSWTRKSRARHPALAQRHLCSWAVS